MATDAEIIALRKSMDSNSPPSSHRRRHPPDLPDFTVLPSEPLGRRSPFQTDPEAQHQHHLLLQQQLWLLQQQLHQQFEPEQQHSQRQQQLRTSPAAAAAAGAAAAAAARLDRRPQRIILVRHGQSEGNVDDTVYTREADSRVRLTAQGFVEAEECGRRIREMIEREAAAKEGEGEDEDWGVFFYVSPYRRTLETLRGIGRAFEPSRILGVREEPRLREQDFGNFQVHEKMRAIKDVREKFGKFFYRFPEGESAADVYDRVSGFLDSFWRDVEWGRIHPPPYHLQQLLHQQKHQQQQHQHKQQQRLPQSRGQKQEDDRPSTGDAAVEAAAAAPGAPSAAAAAEASERMTVDAEESSLGGDITPPADGRRVGSSSSLGSLGDRCFAGGDVEGEEEDEEIFGRVQQTCTTNRGEQQLLSCPISEEVGNPGSDRRQRGSCGPQLSSNTTCFAREGGAGGNKEGNCEAVGLREEGDGHERRDDTVRIDAVERRPRQHRLVNVVVVTHGLTTRVLLMRWFRWTVAQFELMRNPHNCEIRVMQLGKDGGRYSLAVQHPSEELRSWGLTPAMVADQIERATSSRWPWHHHASSSDSAWSCFFDHLPKSGGELDCAEDVESERSPYGSGRQISSPTAEADAARPAEPLLDTPI